MASLGDNVGILHVLKSLESQFISLAGPAPAAGQVEIRAEIGLPDAAIARHAEYIMQRAGATPGLPHYQNTCIGVHEIIRMFHQARLVNGPGGALAQAEGTWSWLQNRLRNHGIDVQMPGQNLENSLSKDWLTLVRMAATAAPLGDILRGVRRTQLLNGEQSEYWLKELYFAFQREGISRQEDRDTITLPFAPIASHDAQRLAWLGLVDDQTRITLYQADGFVRQADRTFREWLNVHLPSPAELIDWGTHQVFDDALAALYGLDRHFEEEPQTVFFARAQGEGIMPGALPGQPAGESDWLKLAMRANTPWPGFHHAIEMQRRLRPVGENNPQSVVPGVPAWTEQNTRDVLAHEGFPPEFSNRLMGLVYEPINIRIINHVLFEALRFPEIAQEINQVTPPGQDWVTNAFLDHGFRPEIARLAANAIRKTAEQRYLEEKNEILKANRKAQRDLVLRKYRLGVMPTDQALEDLKGEFVTYGMAVEMLQLIDEEIRTDFVEVATKEIKAAFLEGKLSAEQVGAQFQVLGVNPARQIFYMQEWIWQKNDRQRMLSTGEVIQALKQGLMTPALALARLVNLGWTAPDAQVELALAEHEIEAAAARVASAQAAKIIAQEEKAKREKLAAEKAKAKEEAAAAKAEAKKKQLAESVPLQATLAELKYNADALLDLNAYLAAHGKGDENKMNAEISRAAQHYTELLLTQLKLKGISPEVASEIEFVEPVEVPPSETDQGAGEGAAGPSP